MPRVKKYPDWVRDLCPAGHTVKYANGKYYLYKTVCRYRPGKSPYPENTYVGRITEEGIIYSKRKKVDTTSAPRVLEYGFSYVLRKLAFEDFRKGFDTDANAESAFLLLLKKHSERSYEVYGKKLARPEDLHICLNCREKAIEKNIGMKIEELYPLRNVYQIISADYTVISEIEPEAEKLIQKLGVTIDA